ncbi:Gfo/Idh/MocA family oxidoreductase [Opitutus sp. GAS368]|uniref:Gfo/Idh/MocA family protein n=1 Tax=Opitutus sp. GAS368 TaxID=1882749 RepID=UPI00087B9C87|nr:Gfo/Idh/MocA family oxidoreductase [Opitutus sp. GAS368]SDS49624.1 Predicted dehydrogenase [Opitutus sp. GAS368]
MSASDPSVLVIGCGSIGERHVRTFLATGRAGVVGCDSRAAVREDMTNRYGIEAVSDWVPVLENPAVSGVVIATPAQSHMEIAIRCLQAGRHVLIEKPLALSLADTDRLVAARDRARRFAGVAYVLHFVPALQAARQFIQAGSLGPVRHVAVNTGQHFPFFRPAYREIYYRDRAQGGGAIQDALTHMANAIEWIVGPTTRVFCDAAHQVLEGVTVEDTVNATARNGPALVSYALNQFQAVNETRWDFHADTGSVRVEMNAQRWGVLARGETEWKWHAAPLAERDQIYAAQAAAFLDGTEGKPNPLCTLEEGIQTLRFNLAALQSWSENRPILP